MRRGGRGLGCPQATLGVRAVSCPRLPSEEAHQVGPDLHQEPLGVRMPRPPYSSPHPRPLSTFLGPLGSEPPSTCFPEDSVSLQISHQAGWRETLRTAQQGDWVDVPELFHLSVLRYSRTSRRKSLRSKILYWLQRKS